MSLRQHHDAARIALAHDWLVGMRGGERVLDRLAQLFGPADLYTLVDDGRHLSDAISRCRIHTSILQRVPGASGALRRYYLPLMPWAVSRMRVTDCDLLISTSSAVMKSLKPPHGVPHLCYCHSPARYIWDQIDDYAVGAGGRLRAMGLRAIRRRFQEWDRRTADRVTKFLANSSHTAARIKRCYERDAEVVYPPVRTEFFVPDDTVKREDWLLVVGALEPYKRADVVIEACNRANLPLKVVGDGSQRNALAAMAGPTVEMVGRVNDEELRNFYRRARALVFPQVEDFGIIAAEAQACGCPVIALGKGGATDIVTSCSGVLFEEQTVKSLLGALDEFGCRRIDPDDCRANSLRFSEQVFNQKMVSVVQDLIGQKSASDRATG